MPEVARAGAARLSFAQERVFEELRAGSVIENPGAALRIRGPLDVCALEQAFAALIERHAALRTTFDEGPGGVPRKHVHAHADARLEHADLSLAGEGDLSAIVAWATEEARRPFALGRAPLARATLLRCFDDDHVLVVAMHPIVSDAWSVAIVVRELTALYAALRQGLPSPLPALPLDAADDAARERDGLEGNALEKQLAFWRSRLSGAPAKLELPSDRPRPKTPSSRRASVSFEIADDTLRAAKELGRARGATLYMVLLAAFDVFLARYTGQKDVVVRSSVANRTRAEVEGIVGRFAHTIAMRTTLAWEETFDDLLARVKDVTLEADAHQDAPFERVLGALSAAPHPPHAAPFRVAFDLESTPKEPLAVADLIVTRLAYAYAYETTSTTLDLTVRLTEREGGGLAGTFDYSTDLFDAPTIERMARHFRNVLESALARPATKTFDLALLEAAERETIVAGWNATAAVHPERWRTLPEAFGEQARRTPNAPAVTFEGETWSYAELEKRTNQLAHRLQRLGVGPDVRVGICMERSLELVVAIVAISKAGGAYVPLEPSYPSERLDRMATDAGLAAVLCTASTSTLVRSVRSEAIDVRATWDEPETPPTDAPHGDSLAYVIYTSGSTGRPKGVMSTHAGLANRIQWMQAAFGLTGADVVVQKTAFSFDVSVWEFVWPLATGARLVVARPDGHRDPAYLRDLFRGEGVTVCHFVPSMLRAFLAELDGALPLRRVISSGEAVTIDLQKAFFEKLPGVPLENLYGPTEASIDVTWWTCRDEGRDLVPIGSPIWNTQAYVVDRALRPVPPGVAGELLLGGVQVARGYVGQAALTAERFVPDPFSSSGGGRLYRTGDLARYRADGTIEYLGRIDHQVKVRGFRIELGEIEVALRQAPGVTDSAAAVHTLGGTPTLIGYVVAPDAVDLGAVRAHLRDTLPEYMVPTFIERLAELPLTSSRKLDRKGLLPPSSGVDDASLTPTERIVHGVLAETFGTNAIGLDDDFAALGGFSLLRHRALKRLQLAGCAVASPALFEHPTVRTLARHIDELPTATAAGASDDDVDDEAPSENQSAIALESRGVTRRWSHVMVGRLKAAVDVKRLEAAFRQTFARHADILSSLRADPETGRVRRIAGRADAFDWDVRRTRLPPVRFVDDQDPVGGIVDVVREEAERGFDVASGPLHRFVVIDGPEQYLVWSTHDTTSDAWSTSVLLRELALAYEGYAGPLPPPRPYREHVLRERRATERLGPELQKHLATKAIAQRTRPTLAASPVLPMAQSSVRHAFSTSDLAAAGERLHVSGTVLLEAAFALALAKSEHPALVVAPGHVAFGVHASNREVEELLAVGDYDALLPMQVEVDGRASVVEWLDALKREIRATHRFEAVGTRTWLAHMSPAARSRAWRLRFNDVRFPPSREGLPTPRAPLFVAPGEGVFVPSPIRLPGIELEVAAMEGRPFLTALYDEAALDRTVVERLLGDIADVTVRLARCSPADRLARITDA